MKIFDLLLMSISNLWKRKLRTVLTVLGVVIGVTSIVVMMALWYWAEGIYDGELFKLYLYDTDTG